MSETFDREYEALRAEREYEALRAEREARITHAHPAHVLAGKALEAERAAAVIDGDSATRKSLPLCSGVLDYFSAALVAIADVSRRGNDKHNPGQPLHWARGKSNDHADCIARHLLDRGTFDAEGVRHSASLAWRALALLQEELEREAGAPVSRGSR